MKQVTKLMIRQYKINQLGYDFMGYSLQKGDNYTFHHLIIPNRKGGACEIWNGAVLCGSSSHPYLHLIEMYDYEIFLRITSEMIDENIKGRLDIYNLKRIRGMLEYFEHEYANARTKRGKILIKEEYKRGRDGIWREHY